MPKHIAIIVLDAFADWEAGFLAAAARTWLGATVSYFTEGAWPVRSMGGMLLNPDGAVAAIPSLEPDALVLVGSSAWERAGAPSLDPVLASTLARDVPLGAICGATIALARAGVLSERRHTSNSRDYVTRHAPGYAGSDFFETSDVAVVDGRLVTAPGSAPASFATSMLSLVWPDAQREIAGFAELMAREHRAIAAH